jgi:hypothetical protein
MTAQGYRYILVGIGIAIVISVPFLVKLFTCKIVGC